MSITNAVLENWSQIEITFLSKIKKIKFWILLCDQKLGFTLYCAHFHKIGLAVDGGGFLFLLYPPKENSIYLSILIMSTVQCVYQTFYFKQNNPKLKSLLRHASLLMGISILDNETQRQDINESLLLTL